MFIYIRFSTIDRWRYKSPFTLEWRSVVNDKETKAKPDGDGQNP